MKKRFLFTLGLIVLSMQAVMAQKAIAMLHHNDTVTIFSNEQVQDAINKAVDGDIIYLSEGVFADFTVGKDITIMGTGKATVIPGMVTIKKSKAIKISNIHVSGTLKFANYYGTNTTISGTKIVQCLIGDMNLTREYGYDLYSNIEITMSQITNLSLSGEVESLTATNSKIKKLSGSGASNSSAKFINCNISVVGYKGTSDKNSFQNCIIGTLYNGSSYNCLYKEGVGGTFTECFKDTDITFDSDLNCSLSESELRKKGYLGTDGSIVGIDGGGSTPFTLASPLLQVVEHEIEIDNKNKRLRVTLNLGNK